MSPSNGLSGAASREGDIRESKFPVRIHTANCDQSQTVTDSGTVTNK